MKSMLGMMVCVFSVQTLSATKSQIEAQLEHWRDQAKAEGWTFDVGETPLMHIPEALRYGYDAKVNAEELRRVPHVGLKTSTDLPKRVDWREQGVVSSIKDQAYPQYCGSCWAFGTVAVVESLIKIALGKDIDLSEQQLVSCPPRYGSCSGGNYAFGFYKEKGANHEADFPYKASNVSCKSDVPAYEKIQSYAYIGSRERGPSILQMKQAIYQYGPIAVTVSASGAWSGYKGGI